MLVSRMFLTLRYILFLSGIDADMISQSQFAAQEGLPADVHVGRRAVTWQDFVILYL